MYRTIYVPVDNSDFSLAALDLALTVGKACSSHLVGSHVYAAKLHDVRFKQMEFTLPEEYKEETELEKQRKIHDALITRGLHLISESYLDQMDARAKEANLSFERKHFDGKNFEALVADVNACGYDLVVMGALGQGAVKDSVVGSVVERLLRRTSVDTVVVRHLGDRAPAHAVARAPGEVVSVCFDGSAASYGGLTTACRLAATFGKRVEILTVIDPASEEAPLLRAHLTAAERYAVGQNVPVTTQVLEGTTRTALCDHAAATNPWLLVVGRTGLDASETGDGAETVIGSTTEHLVRHAPCNVLVAARQR